MDVHPKSNKLKRPEAKRRHEQRAGRRAREQWHRALGRRRTGEATCWAPTGIATFRLEGGQGQDRRVFTIAELLSSRELDEEGRAMGHCVGTYARSCASGRVSIWTLKLADA